MMMMMVITVMDVMIKIVVAMVLITFDVDGY